jgi:TolB-like protein/Tfp pilus assembly protein PilF
MSFFNELKRRNVFRVAIAYVVASWLLLQIADVLVPMLGLPEWAGKLIFLFLLIGFVPALIFAWAYEMTPEGLKREKEVDRTQSITSHTGRKLDRQIMVIMAVALAYFAADKFWLSKRQDDAPAVAQEQVEEQTVRSIAVLPLADMSPQGDHEYFSDGLTEELLNILAKVKDLRVAGRTSSFAFKGKDEDLREIAKKLDVKSILEGSVRKDDARNRVRITLQLINAEDGYHLWSETYDRDLDDIFAIQEEVANEVARALKVTLLGEEEAVVEHVATTDLNAYDLYLRGMKNLNEFSYASLPRAVSDFQQALNLDPTYSPSQVGLLKTWMQMRATGAMPSQEALDNVQPLLALLLQREPDNSDVRVLNARVHSALKDFETAEKEYRLALKLNPRSVEALSGIGSFLINREQISQGLEFVKRAAEIEPYSADVQQDLCWWRLWTRQFEGALAACQRARDIEPDNPMGYYSESIAHAVNGDIARAILWESRAYEVDPDDYELQAELGEFWLAVGDMEKAEEWIGKALSTGPDQARPVSAQITLLMHREQFAQAAELAASRLDVDDRRDAQTIIRNAVVRQALKRGDWQTALEAFRPTQAWAFEDPMIIDVDRPSWTARTLIELAMVIRAGNLTSTKATSLENAYETLINGADPSLAPYLHELWQAALNSARGKSDTALEHLHGAFEKGFRENWRFWVQHWFVFDGLRGEPEYRRLVQRYEEDMERQLAEAQRLVAEEFGP